MNKNNDKKNETLMKVNLNEMLGEGAVRNNLPILTEAEYDELREASEDMMNRMADKGCCWLGLGLVRKAERDLSQLEAVHGNVGTLARMVAEAMNCNPGLEKVFLLAFAMKRSMDKQAETEDNEDEDYNEEED